MQKGFTPIQIILGVLILTLIAGGAYWFGSKKAPTLEETVARQNPNAPFVSPTPKPPSDKPLPSFMPDETLNWKTISGKDYEFKIPPSWEEKLKDNNQEFVISSSMGKIEIWRRTKEIGITIETWFSNDLATAPDYDKSSYSISIHSGKKVLTNTKTGQQPMYIIELNNHEILHITLSGMDNKKLITVFNQVLSTFKFTD